MGTADQLFLDLHSSSLEKAWQLEEVLKERIVIIDGAMGTMIQVTMVIILCKIYQENKINKSTNVANRGTNWKRKTSETPPWKSMKNL